MIQWLITVKHNWGFIELFERLQMTIKVFITIDTEEDNWNEYSTSNNSVENIGQLPLLQDLFDKYNAIPTYLINYPVATTPSSIKILSGLLERGVCEIGAHCHPWNTPPFSETLSTKNSMMCNLPYEILIEKMRNLHEAIKSNFHTSPLSFRAGRWGLNNDVARCLQELDFKIDTSISPYVDWSKSYGPNFRKGSTFPYFFDSQDIFKATPNGKLLEVQPTIGYLQSNFNFCDTMMHKLNKPPFSKFKLIGFLSRLGILNFHWLSPELASCDEMIGLAKRYVEKGHKFLNMSFHSTSMYPGKSPFVSNENDLQKLLNRIECFLKYAADNDFEFLPLSDSIKHM